MKLTVEQVLKMGISAHKKGKLQDAERFYQAILQSQHLHPDANHNLGVLAVSTNRVEAALPLFKTALRENPRVEQFWLSYIDALIKARRFDDAKQVIEQAKNHSVAAEKLTVLKAGILTTHHSTKSAASPLKKKKLSLSERRKKAAEYRKRKKAIRLSSEPFIPTPEEESKLLELYHAGELSDAKHLAQSLTERFPNYQLAWKVLATALQTIGEVEQSLIAAKELVRLAPQDPEAYCNLGDTLFKLEKLKEAREALRQAIKLRPEYALAHNKLGNTLAELGEWNEAKESYDKAIALQPDLAKAYFDLGYLHQKQGKLGEAAENYTKSLAINPDLFEAHYNLGNLLQAMGRLNEAAATYRKAITTNPNFFEAYNNLANTLQSLGQREEAISIYKKAIALNPSFTDLHHNLGIALLEQGKVEEAAEHFDLSQLDKSKAYLLRCLYEINRKSQFLRQLELVISEGENNALIGSLISQSNSRYKIDRYNPFCNEPLKYVVKTYLFDEPEIKTTLVQAAARILSDQKTQYRAQHLLKKGLQTAGNLFTQTGPDIDAIQKIIQNELERYRRRFSGSSEGFITSWPTNYSLDGWFLSMQNGGELNAHMHERGWISGSIYINVPPKMNKDSGNFVVTLAKEKVRSDSCGISKSIDVVTGSLCLFPSSLHHYTIPFESDENRIVLAFDMVPKT